MHMFHATPSEMKRLLIIAVAILSLAVLGVAAAAWLMGQSSGSEPNHKIVSTVPASQVPVPVAVTAPPSAKDVAGVLHCENFSDSGPAAGGVVLDSGTCWLNGFKYAIDTFASAKARNAWLPAAEDLGVSPDWETANSVIYRSVG